jgi:hypothetical protein
MVVASPEEAADELLSFLGARGYLASSESGAGS